MTDLNFRRDGDDLVVDEAQLPQGVHAVRDVSPIVGEGLLRQAATMNLNGLDLKKVRATCAALLTEDNYPGGPNGSIVRLMAFEGALIGYFRCFQSDGRRVIGADAVFRGEPRLLAEHEMLKDRRDGHVAHDSNLGRAAKVFVACDEDWRPMHRYSMGVVTPHLTPEVIASLDRLAAHALGYVERTEEEYQSEISSQLAAATPDQLAALPVARIRTPSPTDVVTKRPGLRARRA